MERRDGPSLICLMSLWREVHTSLDTRVTGKSMEPFLRRGDWITLRPVADGLLRRGDIIGFVEVDALIVHRYLGRVTRSGKTLFCQKGDNLSGWGWIRSDQVLGRVEALSRSGRMVRQSDRPWLYVNRLLGLWGWGFVVVAEKINGLTGRANLISDYKQFYKLISTCYNTIQNLPTRLLGLLNPWGP